MLRVTPAHGDITTLAVDAVVTSANPQVRVGDSGGVNGAVHRAGGPAVLAECEKRFPHGLSPGDAGWTTGGHLPARWIIHAVAPNCAAGQRDRSLLDSCYRRALEAADALGAATVAVPLLGAGAYGWPRHDVIRTAIVALAATPTQVREAMLVGFDEATSKRIRSEVLLLVPMRILVAVGILHDRGYQQCRILAGMNASGSSWRISVHDSTLVGDDDWNPRSEHRVLYTTATGSSFLNREVSAAAVADMILAALPTLDRPRTDSRYVAWFRELLVLVDEHRDLPVAYADYFDDRQGWNIGWGSDIRHPAPPMPAVR